jgi:hypothetical protein
MGGCQFELLLKAVEDSGHNIRHILMPSLRHALIPDPADDDLAIMNITLRHVLSDATEWPEPKSDMALARFRSTEEAEALLENAKQVIRNFLSRVHQSCTIISIFSMLMSYWIKWEGNLCMMTWFSMPLTLPL